MKKKIKDAIKIKNAKILIVSNDFNKTVNKLNIFTSRNDIKFIYSQSGINPKEDTIESIDETNNINIKIIHTNFCKDSSNSIVDFDYMINDTENIDISHIPIYNQGFLRINNIEIPELYSFKVIAKENKIENKYDGIIEMKINSINYYIDKLILNKNNINMYATYKDGISIKINNCKPIIEEKGLQLFELDAYKSDTVKKTYKFKFDLNDVNLEE